MSNKLKILDGARKEILSHPSGAVHLWFCYYMNENDAQESWLSLEKIMVQTGLSKPTIIKWRRYLLAHRLLRDTGKRAAEKYKKPTQGAHAVRVLSVDDPNSNSAQGKESLPQENAVNSAKSTANSKKVKYFSRSSNFAEASHSGSGSGSNSKSNSNPSLRDGRGDSFLGGQNQNQNQPPALVQPESEPEPAPVTVVSLLAAPQRERSKKCAPDGTPYPPSFDAKTTANASRIAWLWMHTPADKRNGHLKYPHTDWLCAECEGIPTRVIGLDMYCDTCLPPTQAELKRRDFQLNPCSPVEWEARVRKDEEQAARRAYLKSLVPGTPEYEAEVVAIQARIAAMEDSGD
jgi:hypothetical protein